MTRLTQVAELNVKIFADGADKAGMLEMYANPLIKGFTTNPTLRRKAGVEDYEAFARDIVVAIPDRPISLAVFSDDFDEMERQARKLAALGTYVYVKIPVTNTRGDSSVPLIGRLARARIKVNVTAPTTHKQVRMGRAARPRRLGPERPAPARREARRDEQGVVAGRGAEPVEPLDHRDALAVEHVAQERRLLARRLEAIEVDVREREPSARVFGHDRERGAVDALGVDAEAAGEPAHQAGLAGAQLADQADQLAAAGGTAERLADRLGLLRGTCRRLTCPHGSLAGAAPRAGLPPAGARGSRAAR